MSQVIPRDIRIATQQLIDLFESYKETYAVSDVRVYKTALKILPFLEKFQRNLDYTAPEILEGGTYWAWLSAIICNSMPLDPEADDVRAWTFPVIRIMNPEAKLGDFQVTDEN